jgi:hypothetical protein
MMTYINNYTATIKKFATALLDQSDPSQIDETLYPLRDPDLTVMDLYRKDVMNGLDKVIESLGQSSPGDISHLLLIFGGSSSPLGGQTIADLWIFDPITSLWHVPVCEH